MSVDKTEKLSMVNAELVWIFGGGWWVPDVCGQDGEVVHGDH